jgi:hypothetical protein
MDPLFQTLEKASILISYIETASMTLTLNLRFLWHALPEDK